MAASTARSGLSLYILRASAFRGRSAFRYVTINLWTVSIGRGETAARRLHFQLPATMVSPRAVAVARLWHHSHALPRPWLRSSADRPDQARRYMR